MITTGVECQHHACHVPRTHGECVCGVHQLPLPLEAQAADVLRVPGMCLAGTVSLCVHAAARMMNCAMCVGGGGGGEGGESETVSGELLVS